MSSQVKNRGFGIQTITTKYLGPTNTKGGRIVAKAAGGRSLTRSWDFGCQPYDNHANVAEELANSLDWDFDMFQGDIGPDSYVFVLVAKTQKA